MADSFVCSGATLKCTCGQSQSPLVVSASRTVFLSGDPPMANILDNVVGTNILTFGICNASGLPTSCTPVVTTPWQNGKMDYLVRNNPALLKSSTCICNRGGMIFILDDGQKEESPGIEKQQKIDILKPDSLVLWDVYWEKILTKNDAYQKQKTKIRFIPWQEKVDLVLIFYYEHDNDKEYDKGTALFKLNIDIPNTIYKNKKYTIKGSDVQKEKTNESVIINKETRILYKYVITNFSSDLTGVNI